MSVAIGFPAQGSMPSFTEDLPRPCLAPLQYPKGGVGGGGSATGEGEALGVGAVAGIRRGRRFGRKKSKRAGFGRPPSFPSPHTLPRPQPIAVGSGPSPAPSQRGAGPWPGFLPG